MPRRPRRFNETEATSWPLNKEKIMGLDMFLYREYNLTDQYLDDQVLLEPLKKSDRFKNYHNFTIRTEIAYWRKANQIHRWFVNNVQEGIDDCRETYVNAESLSDLLKVVTEVLRNGTEEFALEKLPPSPGFCFGSSTVDKSYWENLKDTKKMIEEVLRTDDDDASYFYWASW
jgi:hypothetical protein